MRTLRLVLLVILSTAHVVAAHAADDVSASEKKKILELMDIIGAKNIGRQVSVSFAQELSYGLKQSQPDIDPQAFKVVAAVTDEELSKNSSELRDNMVPLYAKHFTEADLDALLAFYRSPIGRQYKSPLDYLIPFIKETYEDTDKLVIATNYEETSFMYYLNSKVIIGYVGNNLEEDIQMVPDIVIFRKGWGSLNLNIFLGFLQRDRYERCIFSCF